MKPNNMPKRKSTTSTANRGRNFNRLILDGGIVVTTVNDEIDRLSEKLGELRFRLIFYRFFSAFLLTIIFAYVISILI
jgi:hypothetical protein